MAEFLLRLDDSRHVVGIVDAATFAFDLKVPLFAYSGNAANHQKLPSKQTGRLKAQQTKQHIFRRPV